MPAELTLSVATLYGFLLVLARISAAFVFVPIPGTKDFPDGAKIVISLALTIALFPFWPRLTPASPSFGQVTAWILSEAAFGLTVGLAVAFLNESLMLAAQILGLQAGYSYASTIDPTNQTDISVLQLMSQLIAGLLFFAFGLDRVVIAIFARSLQTYPPGTYVLNASVVEAIQRLGAAMFATGFRLALPVIALLMLVDLALALLGRINSQLQLLTLAFPLKMLGALAALAAMAVLFPPVYEKAAHHSFSELAGILR
jgi:flagellar biosynthesis protein FliR